MGFPAGCGQSVASGQTRTLEMPVSDRKMPKKRRDSNRNRQTKNTRGIQRYHRDQRHLQRWKHTTERQKVGREREAERWATKTERHQRESKRSRARVVVHAGR